MPLTGARQWFRAPRQRWSQRVPLLVWPSNDLQPRRTARVCRCCPSLLCKVALSTMVPFANVRSSRHMTSRRTTLSRGGASAMAYGQQRTRGMCSHGAPPRRGSGKAKPPRPAARPPSSPDNRPRPSTASRGARSRQSCVVMSQTPAGAHSPPGPYVRSGPAELTASGALGHPFHCHFQLAQGCRLGGAIRQPLEQGAIARPADAHLEHHRKGRPREGRPSPCAPAAWPPA